MTVYVKPDGGETYHRTRECANADAEYEPTTEPQAREDGYYPCRSCYEKDLTKAGVMRALRALYDEGARVGGEGVTVPQLAAELNHRERPIRELLDQSAAQVAWAIDGQPVRTWVPPTAADDADQHPLTTDGGGGD